jgi:uncharacterized protein (DUF433 family)
VRLRSPIGRRPKFQSVTDSNEDEILSDVEEYSMEKVVTRDPEILGGEPVFAGSRVPIKGLFDHLEAGDSIADFLEGFPSVKRERSLPCWRSPRRMLWQISECAFC